jgi:hypothetical protein
MDVRIVAWLASTKYIKGKAAIKGMKALYRHLRSIQSSSIPIKPPNRIQTAKVSGAETAVGKMLGAVRLVKYIKKR